VALPERLSDSRQQRIGARVAQSSRVIAGDDATFSNHNCVIWQSERTGASVRSDKSTSNVYSNRDCDADDEFAAVDTASARSSVVVNFQPRTYRSVGGGFETANSQSLSTAAINNMQSRRI
jgi:hypothetical protein